VSLCFHVFIPKTMPLFNERVKYLEQTTTAALISVMPKYFSISYSTCSSCPAVGKCVDCPTCNVKQCIGNIKVNEDGKPYCGGCVAKDSLKLLGTPYYCQGCQKKMDQPPLVRHVSLRVLHAPTNVIRSSISGLHHFL
jgi:hypothetical protein